MATRRGRRAAAQPQTPPPKLHESLVLFEHLLALFGAARLDDLGEGLQKVQLEGEDCSEHYLSEVQRFVKMREAPLGELDVLRFHENIVAHTRRLNERRVEMPVRWRYFQYLALLLSEAFLEQMFEKPDELLRALNARVATYNEGRDKRHHLPPYCPEDLRKLAFWCATGSGKTLLMHVHLLQYRQHLARAKERGDVPRYLDVNLTLLVVPNDGLAQQHLRELAASGIEAEIFDPGAGAMFRGQKVQILSIHKLKDEHGPTTIAVDSLDTNNLVFVDEGHRGASGEDWMAKRGKIAKDGFTFEYSATFGQAVGDRALFNDYARAIAFDYSYKHFHRDGYGKDYRILNLRDDGDEEATRLYLTACVLAYYQQLRVFHEHQGELSAYHVARPLLTFVGTRVSASGKDEKPADVIHVLTFLAELANRREDAVRRITRLLSGATDLLDKQNRDLFVGAFDYLKSGKSGTTNPSEIYDDLLRQVFGAKGTGKLHVAHRKEAAGEITIAVGGAEEPFGLINVGDAGALMKEIEKSAAEDIVPRELEVGGSLFKDVDDAKSPIQVLIGARKFAEGWNSYRVSTMGFINVGTSEGATAIQLFGRGVRLKGYNFGLKRSAKLRLSDSGEKKAQKAPPYLRLLETLNIFGVRAAYMETFESFLKAENDDSEDDVEVIHLPVVRDPRVTAKLHVPWPSKGKAEFTKEGPRFELRVSHEFPIKVSYDAYPRIEAEESRGVRSTQQVTKHEALFGDEHVRYLDRDRLYFALVREKKERGYWNLKVTLTGIDELLKSKDWYTLKIPPAYLKLHPFRNVQLWQEIAERLLKDYAKRLYAKHQAAFERKYFEYEQLELYGDKGTGIEDRLLPDEITVSIPKKSTTAVQRFTALRDKLQELQAAVKSGKVPRFDELKLEGVPEFRLVQCDAHLYAPLLFRGKHSDVHVTPVALNDGEVRLVEDLHKLTRSEAGKALVGDAELYLLRNESRRGVGFFQSRGFFPDFILWIVKGAWQCVGFLDPHGLVHEPTRQSEKIQLYKALKDLEGELESTVPGQKVALTSFVLSTTRYVDIPWKREDDTREAFEQDHVLFPKDDEGYLAKLLGMMLDLASTAKEAAGAPRQKAASSADA